MYQPTFADLEYEGKKLNPNPPKEGVGSVS